MMAFSPSYMSCWLISCTALYSSSAIIDTKFGLSIEKAPDLATLVVWRSGVVDNDFAVHGFYSLSRQFPLGRYSETSSPFLHFASKARFCPSERVCMKWLS